MTDVPTLTAASFDPKAFLAKVGAGKKDHCSTGTIAVKRAC
jgi:hypothetical protein